MAVGGNSTVSSLMYTVLLVRGWGVLCGRWGRGVGEQDKQNEHGAPELNSGQAEI